jgi:hypothetical protein
MGNQESTPEVGQEGDIGSQFSNANSTPHLYKQAGFNFDQLSFPLIKSGKVTQQHMNEAFSKLPELQRVMIHKITKNLTQIMLENHRSLTLLFSFM